MNEIVLNGVECPDECCVLCGCAHRSYVLIGTTESLREGRADLAIECRGCGERYAA